MATLTFDDVLLILGRDCPEPDYTTELTLEEFPFLEKIIAGADLVAAQRALLAAVQIAPERARPLVLKAAQSPIIETRIGAAVVARKLPVSSSSPVIQQLLGDVDSGVVKFALRAAESQKLSNLKPKIERLSREAPSSFVRKLADRVTRSLD